MTRERVVFGDVLVSELRNSCVWLVCRAYRVGRLRAEGDKNGLRDETDCVGVDARYAAVKADAAMERYLSSLWRLFYLRILSCNLVLIPGLTP